MTTGVCPVCYGATNVQAGALYFVRTRDGALCAFVHSEKCASEWLASHDAARVSE